ncbi:hypothetical protein [Hymenobacter elongatus]|uniref:Uncharacterized protein n=1 Tax=Hymenobacter elongatus TaxID=877208 RepID=A0A4Z0PEC1_9BACT|nr:hypothetical protein [Hymenobacter elongatus]TGE12248.1 hypothetical protein E5J99_20385 [Hymenobacter elongatus]
MAIDVTLLLTRAQCDAVTTELDKRLRRLDNREQNFDYQDEISTERASELNAELIGLNNRITNLDTYLPTLAEGSKEHERSTDERRKADDRRGDIGAMLGKRGGVKAVLGQSALKETLSRSTSLEDDKTTVATHRASLAA